MKRVIFNADDFGASHRVNMAVVRAHRDGVLTSASLMTAESGFAEAVEFARANPTLGVGLHVAVTCGNSVLHRDRIPHLVDCNGAFRTDPLRAGLVYGLSRAARAELQLEMEAQFERFAATGLPWSHADGHQHCHIQPAVWSIFIELCERYRVRRIRIPREPLRAHLQAGGGGSAVNSGATLILQILCRRSLRSIEGRTAAGCAPIFTCGRVHGVYQTGGMSTGYVGRLIDRLPEGCTELYLHPGSDHAQALLPAHRRDGVDDVEMETLLDEGIRSRFDAPGIERVTYAEAELRGDSG